MYLLTNPSSTALTKTSHEVNQTAEGGTGRLITASWKSLLITVNLHLQTCKNWTICKSEILCHTKPKSQEMQSLWLFSFTKQFSDWTHIDWIHTVVAKPHKNYMYLYWWDESGTSQVVPVKITPTFLRSDSTPTHTPLSLEGWYPWFSSLRKLVLLSFLITTEKYFILTNFSLYFASSLFLVIFFSYCHSPYYIHFLFQYFHSSLPAWRFSISPCI